MRMLQLVGILSSIIPDIDANNNGVEKNMVRQTARIKAITFDGDGTLWDFEKVMQHSLQKVMEELTRLDPVAVNSLTIEKMIQIRNEVAERLKGQVTNLEDIRLEAFRQTLIDIDRPNDKLAVHLNQVYLKHRFEDIELYEDVIPTLNALKNKYDLGLLSNGNSYPERCGLEGIFQFVIFSQDYGFEKPDVRIFQIALDKAGCSREELLHVGDSFENDIMGARNAGIQSVWLNRHEKRNLTDSNADHEVLSLSELLNFLE